jgi:polysaccharide deacetylase family protein (PEP-CTERM system associated)
MEEMPESSSQAVNILSVDVEDYFHVEAFSDRITSDMWPSFSRRVAGNTKRLLDLFAAHNAKATFFVLGWVAKCEPQIVREILAAGHEVACHSYLHRSIWRLTPDEFRADTRQALDTIEDAGGTRALGYRAPIFSIFGKSLWALDILAEQGFVYDSSVFPIRHDNYGMPDAPRFAYRWDLGDGKSILEIPPLTVRFAGYNLPAAGGGYLRILPMWYTRWALHRVRSFDSQPVALYLHPWEVDPEQPRMQGRWKSKLRHYLNISKMESRLSQLLERQRFVSFSDYVDQIRTRKLKIYKPETAFQGSL